MSEGRLQSFLNGAIVVVGCAMAVYHLASTQYLFYGVLEHQVVHLAFAMTLVFLSTLKYSKKLRPIALPLLAMGIAVPLYVLFSFERLESSVGFLPETMDWVIGIILIVAVIEGTREGWGRILPIMCIIFILYFLFGHLLPAPLRHSPFKPEFVISMLGVGFHGVFGDCLRVSANFIFIFVLFGGILQAIGAHHFFLQLGRVAGRYLSGGGAQATVVCSGLVGMVMGETVTNVALMGPFTIPFMKKLGYTSEQAGGIEAAASCGGQIMPPIMGSTVFLMASFLGIAYADLMGPGLVLAILFFLSIALGIRAMAKKGQIQNPKEKIDFKELMVFGPVFLVPLTVLVGLLLVRVTPAYAGFYTILSSLAVCVVRKETRPSLRALVKGFVDGSMVGARIGVALGLIGMMIQVMTTTGLGVTISSIVEELAGENLWFCLLITMVLSIFLGTGLPVIAAYAIVAVIVVPVIIKMGVVPMAAHFFAFYYAIFSTLTPPVALASMASSGIAGGNFFKTSWEAFRLTMPAYLLPFFLVYNPASIISPLGQASSLWVLAAITLSLWAMVSILYGYLFAPLSLVETLGLVLSIAIMIAFSIAGNYFLLAAGAVLFGAIGLFQRRKEKKSLDLGEISRPVPAVVKGD